MTKDIYMLTAFTGLAAVILTLFFMAIGYVAGKTFIYIKELMNYDDRF